LIQAQAVNDGFLSEAVLNKAVARVLKAKLRLGVFDDPYVELGRVREVFDTEADRSLALRAARESIVLLKNDGILPLDPGTGVVAVVGPNASNGRNLLGDYSHTAHIPSEEAVVPLVSVLEGIKSKVSPQVDVLYVAGCEVVGTETKGFDKAIKAASKSEVVIAVVGERSGLSEADVSGEGRDRASLRLPGSKRLS